MNAFTSTRPRPMPIATEFFEDEVDGYLMTFQNRVKFMTGGHVKGWDVYKEPIGNHRVIVRVVQHVE